ncbi:hypothetical protein SLOPH_1039, partial [Spraguea lophii 42_110]
LKIFIFIVNKIYSSQTLKQKTDLDDHSEDNVLYKSPDVKEDIYPKSCFEEENNEIHDNIEKDEIIRQHPNLIWIITSCVKKYVYDLCLNFISYFKYDDQSLNNDVIKNRSKKDRIKKRNYDAAGDLYVSSESDESSEFDFLQNTYLFRDPIDRYRFLPFDKKRRTSLEF